MPERFDVIVVGAGAAGLMCAITAGQRGRRVLVLDHANKPGKKILMSGGGRCNFTNLDIEAEHFLSANPHFCKSALSRYTQWDFIALVASHSIPYHEKSDGQLFCDHSSKDILQMLLAEAGQAGVEVRLNTGVETPVQIPNGGWSVLTNKGELSADSVVIATGGPPIPTLGATDWGHRIARHFGHEILPYRPSLVPYTADLEHKATWSELSGVSMRAELTVASRSWVGDVLFTHRGLSGPAVLQITNYWREGEPVVINWCPDQDVLVAWQRDRHSQGRKQLRTWLSEQLPRRFVNGLMQGWPGAEQTLADIRQDAMAQLAEKLHRYSFQPSGTEGYRTAEVTLGGVSTTEISSRTMESQRHAGLFFIGEVLDVTGHLGGYNFQWAWSSGHAAGEVV
ncbi:NAD(P)/FAD-dependent oxidoreductase [Salinispirillum marinum]|uniref:NAD(P)/FAD-dependent oxidoreductase n=2 Tax=Saccharospirillaceae TaxID=255527 RepID=A0ABV8BIZ0_9GAMM